MMAWDWWYLFPIAFVAFVYIVANRVSNVLTDTRGGCGEEE